MGKESRIRQERKSAGLTEKPQSQHRDRFPIVMRIVAIALAVILATWGSLFALKSATGSIAYQVGTETVLQSDINAQIQSYVDMYKQYGIDLTTEENVSMLKSIRKSVTNSAIEQQLYVQYAKSKNMTLDETKFKEAVDTEVENAVNQPVGRRVGDAAFLGNYIFPVGLEIRRLWKNAAHTDDGHITRSILFSDSLSHLVYLLPLIDVSLLLTEIYEAMRFISALPKPSRPLISSTSRPVSSMIRVASPLSG